MPNIVAVREEIVALNKQQEDVLTKFPGFEDAPDDVMKEVKTRHERISGLKLDLERLRESEDIARLTADTKVAFTQPANANGLVLPNGNSAQAKAAQAQLSIGRRFTESSEFKDWIKQVAPQGHIPESFKGFHSPPLTLEGVSLKNLITGASDTQGGAFVSNDILNVLVEASRRPLTLLDIITRGETDSDTVEYVRVTSETNAAAPTAEATAATGTSGSKPESAVAFVKVTESVKTIAHWIPVTKRALSDARQLRTYIDNFLRFGLEEELEDQIATGDGVGENFTGIANTSNTQSQAFDTSILVTARKARTLVATVGRSTPTAYVMNPLDWEKFDLMTDNENRYYFGGPTTIGTPRLWGLPVVESEAIPEGTMYVGDWRMAVLWDREQMNISVSDSHSDFFIRNLVAILAEMRAAFGVLRPAAFVEVDLTA